MQLFIFISLKFFLIFLASPEVFCIGWISSITSYCSSIYASFSGYCISMPCVDSKPTHFAIDSLWLLLWTFRCEFSFCDSLFPHFTLQGIHKRMARFQKLTRNLFLTLHGHNVHRQQRQLSKFLMRYQQFASHAYCGAAGPVSRVASQQEKTFCVLRFEVSRSVITVQLEFRVGFRKDAPCTVITDLDTSKRST